MIKDSIFKSYDVRGIFPEELSLEVAEKIGRAFVNHTGAKKIALARDGRTSSLEIFESVVKGILSQGADVYDLGQVPTECLYFSIGFKELDGGIMITASHNPKEYNGFKIIKKEDKDITIVRGKELVDEVKKDHPDKENRGKIESLNIIEEYVNYVVSKFDLAKLSSIKVGVDTSNGVAAKIISSLAKKLPVFIETINFEIDGEFPGHSPNPLEEGSQKEISNLVKTKGLKAGFIFDGDGDRVFLIDEKGESVPADATLLLLVKKYLENNQESAIAYNVICSKSVPEFIEKWGGVPIKTKVGFVNVREGLIRNEGVMGGELSGHYCFSDNFYFDSGVIAFLALLGIISQEEREVSEMVKEVSPYFKASEINFRIDDKEGIIEKAKEKYQDGNQSELDGITVEYSDWWFNIRPSNTEPVLRLTIEANTKELLEKKKKELSDFIKK